MNYKEIRIDEEVKYYSQIDEIYPIPTNVIIDKTLPGLGITHAELIFPRHKIIILPNLPPIFGKGAKHPECLAVHGKVNEENVTSYLNNVKFKIKKIICTPEAYYSKVKPALIRHPNYNLYKDFFFLFDECDKLVSDVSYRGNITLPMEDFFKFENKAMVSATPLIPSDPRFEKNEFTFIKIKPDYNYKKDIKIILTDNVLQSFKNYVSDSNDRYFIFFNSTDGIISLINNLKIKNESSIFCSDKSANKIKTLNQSSKVYTELGNPKSLDKLLSKFNFFTSRFYSAVDLDLEEDANVILISDLFFASHSILDPNTDVRQIQGRFRIDKIPKIKRKGVKSLTHITNYDKDIKYKEEEGSKDFLIGAVNHILKLKQMKSHSNNEGESAAIDESLKNNPYSDYISNNSELNYFMIDNFIHYEKLKKVYSDPQNIISCYNETGFFNVINEIERYPITDFHKLNRTNLNSPKNLESLAEQLNNLISQRFGFSFNISEKEDEINVIKQLNPFLYEAFNELGFEALKNEGFIKSNINAALVAHKWQLGKRKLFKLINEVHKKFPNKEYLDSDIKSELNKIFANNGISYKAKASDMSKFFETSKSTDKENKKTTKLEKIIYEADNKFISKIFEIEIPKGVS